MEREQATPEERARQIGLAKLRAEDARQARLGTGHGWGLASVAIELNATAEKLRRDEKEGYRMTFEAHGQAIHLELFPTSQLVRVQADGMEISMGDVEPPKTMSSWQGDDGGVRFVNKSKSIVVNVHPDGTINAQRVRRFDDDRGLSVEPPPEPPSFGPDLSGDRESRPYPPHKWPPRAVALEIPIDK